MPRPSFIAYASLASYSPHLDTPPATAGSTRSARLMARRLGSRGRRFGPKPECPHQGQRVRRPDNARAHPVVEEHAPILEPVGEVDVDGVDRGILRDLGQRQIMRGDETDRPSLRQAVYDGRGAEPTIVRVRSVEDLVEQEQQGDRSVGDADEVAQADQLRIETRGTLLERVPDEQRRAGVEQRESEAPWRTRHASTARAQCTLHMVSTSNGTKN